MDLFNLKDKSVLIIGGSKGIGYATAKLCLSLGARVTIVARNANEVNTLVSSWCDEGYYCNGIVGDLSRKDDIEKIIQDYQEYNGRTLDCLINLVGCVITKPAIEFTEGDFNSIVDTNLRSMFLVCQLALPLLKRSSSGAIVNISSINALKATPGKVLEGASRAAVVHMTKSLAVEWAEYNIRSNCVLPGLTETSRVKLLSNECIEEIVQNIPLKRMGNPDELASTIVYLCMPGARYITGQCIVADGGVSLS